MLRLSVWPLLALVLLTLPSSDNEIDAFWDEAVRTVEEGDFDGYAALYHADAVLVNGISGESYPISQALAGWKQGFDDTAAGRATAELEFRFTARIHGETTAHETGYFRYSAGEPVYIAFESLLVKEEDGWKWVMEYQKAVVTEADWDAAGE
ncbi:MAG: hypothetical protein Rubg2KO_05370 [Rubricoccaceae bacterium]